MRGADKQNIFVICAVVLSIMVTLGFCTTLSGGGIVSTFLQEKETGSAYYAIAAGGFTEITLARSTAELIKSRGGAGYVYGKEDMEIYYAVYPSEQEAKSVLERLGDSGAYIKEIEIAASKLKWADKDLKQAAQDALAYFPLAFDVMYDASNALNGGNISAEDAKLKTEVLRGQIEDIKSVFYQKTEENRETQVTEIKVALITALALLDNLELSNGDIGAASSIRYQLVQLVLSRQALSSRI